MLSLVSCEEKANSKRFAEINERIEKEYAPDKRVAIYDIEIAGDRNSVRITGETDQKEALSKLKEELETHNVNVQDEVTLLPDSSIGKTPYAVVNNSVANIRSSPRHSAELATQAILGTGLKILKIDGDFYRVQTPDRYIAWVDHGGVQLMTHDDYQGWTTAPKMIYLKTYGHVYSSKDNELDTSGDLVLGCLLKLLDTDESYFKVAYPDGRTGFVRREEGEVYLNWLNELKPSSERLETVCPIPVGCPVSLGWNLLQGNGLQWIHKNSLPHERAHHTTGCLTADHGWERCGSRPYPGLACQRRSHVFRQESHGQHPTKGDPCSHLAWQ